MPSSLNIDCFLDAVFPFFENSVDFQALFVAAFSSRRKKRPSPFKTFSLLSFPRLLLLLSFISGKVFTLLPVAEGEEEQA